MPTIKSQNSSNMTMAIICVNIYLSKHVLQNTAKNLKLSVFDMRVTMEDSHVILNGNLDQPTGRETSPRRWVVGGNYLHPERFTLLH